MLTFPLNNQAHSQQVLVCLKLVGDSDKDAQKRFSHVQYCDTGSCATSFFKHNGLGLHESQEMITTKDESECCFTNTNNHVMHTCTTI